eukprot:15340427-Ditylum_brightwellii.AAC.1
MGHKLGSRMLTHRNRDGRQRVWATAACQRYCIKDMETTEHVFACPKADMIWRELQQILVSRVAYNNLIPGLMAALLSRVYHQQPHEPQYQIYPCHRISKKPSWYKLTLDSMQ